MKTTDEWHGRWINGPGGFAEFIRDVQNDAVAHARAECAAEIERLKAELVESRDKTEGWITLATDTRRERDEARGEVSRLSADIDIANSDVAHWAKHTVELQAELGKLRSHQQPAHVPLEPAESPIDKAARQAWERRIGGKITDEDWSRAGETIREAWRRVVAPFVGVKPEPPKSDGVLLGEICRKHSEGHLTNWGYAAAEFLAKRAERDAIPEQKSAKATE